MAGEAKHMTEEEKKDKQYERLIAARNYHYDNLNKWLMSFYVIIGALFVALYSLHKGNGHQLMELCVAIVGYIVSIAAILSGKGYYYWETNWIMLIHKFEKTYLLDRRKYEADKETYLRDAEDDYRVYSVFADKNANNDIHKLTTGANISTSKVALAITWLITILWGALVIFFGVYLLLHNCKCIDALLAKLLVGCVSVVVAYGMTQGLLRKANEHFYSNLEEIDDLEIGNKNNNIDMNLEDKETRHYEWLIVLVAFIAIIVIMLGVWFGAYRPIFSGGYATSNIEWGGFGDFFWGMGTMLFTALSVWMLYFVNQQLRENQEKQQKQQEKFQAKIEEERQKLLKDIIRKRRMETWLESYNKIIYKLTGQELTSDVVWLYLLREVTIIYKSIVAEQDSLPQETMDKINDINNRIKEVMIQSYLPDVCSKENLKFALLNVALNKDIVDLYFELLNLNKVSFDIDFIIPQQQEEPQKERKEKKK